MIIDLKEKLKETKLLEALCKVFAEKLQMDEEDLSKKIDEVVDKKINNIGRSLTKGNFEVSKNNKDSLDEFMKKFDFDTITKEE